MSYITHNRYRGKAITGGEVNLPAFTELRESDGVLIAGDQIICTVKSNVAHTHFARNDDGEGMTRGGLTRAITTRMKKRDAEWQARWDKVFDDSLCQQYKRPEHDDRWLWNHEFYNAPIDDLRHIATLVGAKEGKK